MHACSGKQYKGEKAVISLTSWKKRIHSVSRTIFSILSKCPGFHIVLVLSSEEFPKMEDDRYYAALKSFLKIPTSSVDGYKMHEIVRFTNDIKSLCDNYRIHDTNYAYKQFKNHIKI